MRKWGARRTKQATVSAERHGRRQALVGALAAHGAAPDASATEFLPGLIERGATYAAPARCTPAAPLTSLSTAAGSSSGSPEADRCLQRQHRPGRAVSGGLQRGSPEPLPRGESAQAASELAARTPAMARSRSAASYGFER